MDAARLGSQRTKVKNEPYEPRGLRVGPFDRERCCETRSSRDRVCAIKRGPRPDVTGPEGASQHEYNLLKH
jgi:hypothetical protein